MRKAYAKLLSGSGIPTVPAGTALADSYPKESAISRMLDLPVVRGAIESLVGPESTLRPSLPARDVSAGVLRSARPAERVAAHAPGFDDRSAPRVRHSDHVLPARRHARDGRHAVRSRHASADRQRSRGCALSERPRPAARRVSGGHAAGSAPRHLARRRREPFRPIALHVQDPHQPDRSSAAAVGYVGSAERSLRAAADLPDQGSARSDERAHDSDDAGTVVRSRHRPARIPQPHPHVALPARRRTFRRRLLDDPIENEPAASAHA